MSSLETHLLKALPQLVPSLRVVRATPQARIGVGHSSGLVVDVLTPRGRRQRVCVVAQSSAIPSRARETLLQLKASLSRTPSVYPAFATLFLSPRMREICREAGVGYLDLAGNALLQFGDCYLERVVDRNPFPVRGRPSSLFSPVSSRILRALLEEPEQRWLLRELSEATGVSLGQTFNVIHRLLQDAYVEKTERRLCLAQPSKLLDAWRAADSPPVDHHLGYYSFEVDPRQLLQRVARIAKERSWRYAVTTFAAASMVAPYVHGVNTVQWYVEREALLEAWVAALDLRPVDGGPNVILRVPRDPGAFYKSHMVDGVTLAGNIQLYLDPCRGPGRGVEQAEFLRKEILHF